tara:strand:+ start:6924 stop:7115 length:192 start_codon:yes stop_codon:yes gene_type:complete
MVVTYFIETDWKDGTSTRYSWRRPYGRASRANLLKLIKGQLPNFVECRLVHADSTIITVVKGK